MKAFLARFMAKLNLVFLPFLAKFGFWGLGALALLDSSTIPVPMDAFLALSVWNDKGHFWLYCLAAAAGSAIGGLLPYGLGRAGGELFLLKRINRKRFEAMRTRFERQEFLAMMIPSMLPPPTPWKAFVFAAGVFEMRVLPFMVAVFAAGWFAGWCSRCWCSSWVRERSRLSRTTPSPWWRSWECWRSSDSRCGGDARSAGEADGRLGSWVGAVSALLFPH